MVLDVDNQLKTALRISTASEPFPHFRGVGTTPCIHGVGSFMALDAAYQLGTTLRASTT